MRLFKKKNNKTFMVFQGETATATRAVYQGRHILPTILMQYDIRQGKDPKTGEQFDHIEIELDVFQASKLANQLLVSLAAALPDRPRGPMRIPFE